MENILSLSRTETNLKITYMNNEDYKGVICIKGFNAEQQILFSNINNLVNELQNYGRKDVNLHSFFELNAIAYKEKANQFALGGSLKVNVYSASAPFTYSIIVDITPEVMENAKGQNMYDFMVLQQDTAIAIQALFMSFDIETLIRINNIPNVENPQNVLEHA
jgi:hypothetical protein